MHVTKDLSLCESALFGGKLQKTERSLGSSRSHVRRRHKLLGHAAPFEPNQAFTRQGPFRDLIEVLHGSHVAWQEQWILFPLGTNVLSNAKHFHCSCHATWLPCKTSIREMETYQAKAALQSFKSV